MLHFEDFFVHGRLSSSCTTYYCCVTNASVFASAPGTWHVSPPSASGHSYQHLSFPPQLSPHPVSAAPPLQRLSKPHWACSLQLQPVDGAKWRGGGGGGGEGERGWRVDSGEGVTQEPHTARRGCCSSQNRGCMRRFVIDSTDGVWRGDTEGWKVGFWSPKRRRYEIR